MSDYTILLFDPHAKKLRSGNLELLDEWAALPDAWIWLNISGLPDEAEKQLFSERFELPELAIHDAQRERHSPKIEVFDKLIFVILRDLIVDEDSWEQRVASFSLLKIGRAHV